jgi:hypothetical protein
MKDVLYITCRYVYALFFHAKLYFHFLSVSLLHVFKQEARCVAAILTFYIPQHENSSTSLSMYCNVHFQNLPLNVTNITPQNSVGIIDCLSFKSMQVGHAPLV